MNTSSHLLMGKLLYQYVEENYNIRLERKNFLLGNILPDYCPSFLLRPHYLKNNAVHVKSILRLLLSRQVSASHNKRFSRLLGILCHFYADFFCHAHSDSFSAGLPEHIAYENRLYRYFTENIGQFRTIRFIAQPKLHIGADDVYRQFEALHSSYLLSHVSFGNDLLYSMMACIDLIVLSSGSAEKNPAHSYPFGHREAI